MCIPFREQLDAKDQRIATLEARLATANEAISRYKSELDEVNALVSDAVKAMEILKEQGRLPRALDRIEAAGYTVHEMRVMDGYFCVWVKKPRHWTEYYGSGDTWAEAAEQAADWAESQKEGKA